MSDAPPPEGDDDTPAPAGGGGAAATTGSRYVPPSLRNRGPGERMPGGPGGGGGSRDDLPTLRVTNISEDVEENDLRDLFGTFGRVARVYVGRDRETGAGKGFAFVSFEDREIAKRAMEKLNGRGYDNLILSVQWSRMHPFYSHSAL
jgi:translation initiation factor 3 subunit G